MNRIITVALLVVVSGCQSSLTNEQRALDAARAAWNSTDWSSYRYELDHQCFCGYVGPVTVTVVNGAVTEVLAQDSTIVIPPERFSNTIDDLFDIIQDAIDRDAHLIRTEYQADTGVPIDAYFDYEEFTIDEEFGFEVRNATRTP